MHPTPLYLVAGLGNPGKGYVDTRHNIGFKVIEQFAKKRGWVLHGEAKLQGDIAQGSFEGTKVLLLQPMTYMNSSGQSVKLCMDYFKVSPSNLMVVSDEIALQLGEIRIKPSGSSGGHNGLKSIEAHLGTQIYPRMRLGVDDQREGSLADHVLSRFKEEEMANMPSLLERATLALEIWIKEGIVKAMQYANGRQEERKPEQNVGE